MIDLIAANSILYGLICAGRVCGVKYQEPGKKEMGPGKHRFWRRDTLDKWESTQRENQVRSFSFLRLEFLEPIRGIGKSSWVAGGWS